VAALLSFLISSGEMQDSEPCQPQKPGPELVSAEERNELLDLVPDAIFVRGLATAEIRYWNQGAERLYGWSAAEALGKISHELLRTYFPESLETIEATLTASGFWEGELIHTAKDGQRIVASSRWALRRDDRGQPTAILEVNTDITNRILTEQRLREQAALLDLVPDAVLVRDFVTGRIKFWNRGAETLYGWTAFEAVGQVHTTLLQSTLSQPLADVDAQLVKTGHWEGEIEQMARDGTQRTVSSRWALRHDEHGQPQEILVISTDVTDRKRAELELSRLAAVEAALAERDQLLTTVSHDLKTPLTTIRGQAEILLRHIERSGEVEQERARKGLELVRTAAVRMATWIDDLLDSARLEAGRSIVLHRQAMDLVALAWQAAAEHQRTTEKHRIRVETAESRLIGLWDPIRLRRVLDNLLSNAIKYSPNGGDVVICVALQEDADGPVVCVSVTDHGVGIPQADQPHIFERFRRAGNVGRIAGVGIGLAGVRIIVQEHGGRIDLQSREGEGTTFSVHLPLRLRQSTEERAA
jgi:PAS domain S-box-containing protein